MLKIALKGLGNYDHVFSEEQRDGGYQPWLALRKEFLRRDVLLATSDMPAVYQPDYEIHINAQPHVGVPAYLIAIEPPQVLGKNYSEYSINCYRKIFTWRDDLLENKKFTKIHYPNPLSLMQPVINGWSDRPRFSCIIAANKSIFSKDERELYSERVRVIRWFEKKAPSDFELYGIGWDHPIASSGIIGRAQKLLPNRILRSLASLKPIASYRGKISHKRDVLLHTRFSFCYENVRDLPGYITEKIFDSFFSGCVPIYWGANNINDYVPENCFVDRRKFKDMDDLYSHLMQITEDEYCNYQKNIAIYLESEAAYPFGSESFAESIVDSIVNDIVLK